MPAREIRTVDVRESSIGMLLSMTLASNMEIWQAYFKFGLIK